MLREKSLGGKRLDGIGRAFLIKDFSKVTENRWGPLHYPLGKSSSCYGVQNIWK